MRKEDVLISEYRVTVLGDGGQYTFDWVDEDSRTVEFVESKSDFPDYNDEVTDALAMKGISIHKDNNQSMNSQMDSQMDSQTLDTPGSTVEPELESEATSKSDSTEPDPITPIEPDSPEDSSDKDQSKEEASLSSESRDPEPIGGGDFSPVEDNGGITPDENDESSSRQKKTRSEKEMHDSTSDSSKDYEEVSFIVRMSDPSEREQAINSITDSDFDGSVDMLRLTGPFKVTYRIEDGSVELVGVEDMGIGSEVED